MELALLTSPVSPSFQQPTRTTRGISSVPRALAAPTSFSLRILPHESGRIPGPMKLDRRRNSCRTSPLPTTRTLLASSLVQRGHSPGSQVIHPTPLEHICHRRGGGSGRSWLLFGLGSPGIRLPDSEVVAGTVPVPGGSAEARRCLVPGGPGHHLEHQGGLTPIARVGQTELTSLISPQRTRHVRSRCTAAG